MTNKQLAVILIRAMSYFTLSLIDVRHRQLVINEREALLAEIEKRFPEVK